MSISSASRGRALESLAILLVAAALTFPVFVEIYRTNVFQTEPRDDYAPYLLKLAGDGGRSPGAPFVYRILSVAVAIPLYRIVPPYRFSQLGSVDPAYLQATEALAIVSWAALALLMVVVFRVARDRFAAGRAPALCAALAVPLVARYTQDNGVDPLAMLLVGCALYWFAVPWAFAALVACSALFNEKVVLIAVLLVAARVLGARSARAYRVHVIGCALGVIAYMVLRAVIPAQGNEQQTSLASYPVNALRMLRLTVSGKGLLQNVYPVALLLAAYAWAAHRLRGLHSFFWSRWDVLVPLGLTVTGIAVNVKFTLGRLALQSFPLVLPALAAALDASASARRAGGPSLPTPG